MDLLVTHWCLAAAEWLCSSVAASQLSRKQSLPVANDFEAMMMAHLMSRLISASYFLLECFSFDCSVGFRVSGV